MGWSADDVYHWRKRRPGFEEDVRFNLGCSRWELETFFQKDLSLMAQQRMRESVDCAVAPTPFDWTISRRVCKGMTKLQKAALQAWHQGSLRTARNSEVQTCPLCQVPLNVKHLVWECKWVNARCHTLPEDLQSRLHDRELQETWQRGWVHEPFIPQRASGRASMQGHGCWSDFECWDHAPGWHYGLAIKLTGQDKRLQQMVVALVCAEQTPEGMRERGSLTALVERPCTVQRGYLLGLTMLIEHTEGELKISIPYQSTVRMWKRGLPFPSDTDIVGGITEEWHAQIELSYRAFTKKEVQGSFCPARWVHERALAVAKSRVRLETDPVLDSRVRADDRFHARIYEHAIEKVSAILSHKEHFLATQSQKKGQRA